MTRFSTNSIVGRGAVAALLSAVLFQAAPAQTGGVIMRTRDTAGVRMPDAAHIDSITTLFRRLQREAYGSPEWNAIARKMDSLMTSGTLRVMMRSEIPGGGAMAAATTAARVAEMRAREVMPRGWLGFQAQGPTQRILDDNGLRITYFAYPSIISVDPESPAERAGIVPGDVLVAYNGVDVVGHEFNFSRLLIPEKKLAVTVKREGESKDYTLDIAKAPEPVSMRRLDFERGLGVPFPPMPPNAVRVERVEKGNEERHRTGGVMPAAAPRVGGMASGGGGFMGGRSFPISATGIFGANLSTVGSDLAKVLKIEKGMLVNEVPEESAGFKSGLRTGDVIVAAGGLPVATLRELQDLVVSRLGDRSVPLSVVRDHKPVKVTVTW
jgi:serine protease Do